jgi:hypothetical protein
MRRFSDVLPKVGGNMKANLWFVLLLTALSQGGEPARVLAQDAPDRPAMARDDKSKGGATRTMVNMRAQHKDRRVWSVDWVNNLAAPNKPYVTLRASERRD